MLLKIFPVLSFLVQWAYRGWLARETLHFVETVTQRGWRLIVGARPLSEAEVAASREVHVPGQIAYDKVWVTEHSPLCRLSRGRAMCTMHIVHYPNRRLELATVVHELTHAAQYRHAGPIYMLQALHAQILGGGYDYGDLIVARLGGKRFRHLNREQQAQVCEDYYRLQHGLPPRFRGTLAALTPYIYDMRRGDF